jgi:hypothetical protein
VSFKKTTSAATLRTQVPKAPVRWLQIPVVNGDVIVRRDGSMAVLEDEVGTSEAKDLLGCSVRHVQELCDEGRLVEGGDWRKLPSRGRRGVYRIRTAALLALRLSGDTESSEVKRGGRIQF